MINDWKKFEAVNQKVERRMTVTRSGYIGFPTQFYQENKIAEYSHVVFYYSAIEKAIGIKFVNDENEKGAVKIHKNKEGKGGWVVAKGFFRANNIEYKNYNGRYEWVKENSEATGDLYVIKLKEKIGNTST